MRTWKRFGAKRNFSEANLRAMHTIMQVECCALSFFGLTLEEDGRELITNMIQGQVHENRRRGRPMISFREDTTKWTDRRMGTTTRDIADRG